MAHGQKSSDADPLRRRMTHSSLGTCMKKDFLAEASDFPIRHPIREILVHEVSNLYCDRGWRICPGEIPFLYWHLSRREKKRYEKVGYTRRGEVQFSPPHHLLHKIYPWFVETLRGGPVTARIGPSSSYSTGPIGLRLPHFAIALKGRKDEALLAQGTSNGKKYSPGA